VLPVTVTHVTTYGQDCQVVAKYQITTPEDKVIMFDLTNLTVDQIRMLCQSICVTNYSLASKFQCWSLIASYIGNNKNLVEAGVNHHTDEDNAKTHKVGTILEDVSNQLCLLIATIKECAVNQAVQQKLENKCAKDAVINQAVHQKLENENAQEAVKNQAKVLKWESRLRLQLHLVTKLLWKNWRTKQKHLIK
jgi:hypothetical protein